MSTPNKAADYWKYRLAHEKAAHRGTRRMLLKLVSHWTDEARAFHKMGREMVREMNMAGHEYLQTAAAFRACASQLKSQLRIVR